MLGIFIVMGTVKASEQLYISPVATTLDLSLVENTENCLGNCYLRFKIKPDKKLTIPDISSQFTSKFIKGTLDSTNIIDWGYRIKQNVTYKVPDYKEVCYPYKITDINGTWDVPNCTVYTSQKEIWQWEWVDFNPYGKTYNSGEWVEIELWAKRKAKLGENSIDAIPNILGYDLPYAWWNTTYTKRRNITISMFGHDTLVNYQVGINVTYDSDMDANFNDLRFTDTTGAEIDFWVEKNVSSGSAYVWLEVPSISQTGNTTVSMYYGSGDTSSTSDGAATFLMFDDFNTGGLNTTKWKHHSGLATVVMGQMYINVDSVYGAENFTTNTSIKFGANISAVVAGIGEYGFEGKWPDDFMSFFYHSGMTATYSGGSNYQLPSQCGLVPSNSVIEHEVFRNGTANVDFYKWQNKTLCSNHTTFITTNVQGAFFWSSASDAAIDWVFIRKYNFPDPTFEGNMSLLGEETASYSVAEWSNPDANSTSNGTWVNFTMDWDNPESELSHYIFSFDNCTGAYVNDSAIGFANALSTTANATKFINTTDGCTINWLYFANTTRGHWNVSSTQSFVTLGEGDFTITNCSTVYTKTAALRLLLYNETTRNPMHGDIDAYVVTWKTGDLSDIQNNSFHLTGNNTYYLCIYPTTGTYQMNATFQYYNISANVSYARRNWFIFNMTLDNVVDDIKLYMISDTEGSRIKFKLRTAEGFPSIGKYLKFQRYYIDVNQYIGVGMARTDQSGETIIYLQPYEIYYKILVEDENNQILKSFSAFLITSSEMTLALEPVIYSDYFNYFEKIAFNCTWNNVTENFGCTVNDNTGKMSQGCLKVYETNLTKTSLTCSQCSSASSFTIACNLADPANRTFNYILDADLKYGVENRTILLRGSLQFSDAQSIVSLLVPVYTGIDGVLLSMFVIGTMGFIGIWHPSTALILMLISMGILVMINVLAIQWEILFGLIFVAGVIIYMVEFR